MKKTFLYTLLGLMGIMGALSIGVASADTSCWSTYGGTVPTSTYASNIVYGCDENNIPIITIYGKNGNNGDVGITIKAMNEGTGTVTIGSGYDKSSYGALYQWGNSYPFPNVSDTTTPINSGSSAVSAALYGPNTTSGYYYSGTWIKQNVWDIGYNVNLRGGAGDMGSNGLYSFQNFNTTTFIDANSQDRQVMCPEGYHIPSQGEWHALFYLWGKNYDESKKTSLFENVSLNKLINVSLLDGAGMSFSSDMQIPFANFRVVNTNLQTYAADYGNYWSSSPVNGTHTPNKASNFSFNSNQIITNSCNSRGVGMAVRCFKNSYAKPSQIFTINFTGSGQGSISIGSVEAEEGTSISRSDEVGSVTIAGTVVATGIANEGYVFSGWLTDCVGPTITTACNFTGVFKPVEYTIHFDGNGAEVGNMEDISATYNTNYLINVTADNWFKKVGYIYRGLYTGADISGYTNEEKQALELGQGNGIFNVSNLTTENGAVVTLYPNWGERKYKIVYNANGLNGEIANTECYYENTNCSLSNGEGFYKQGLTLIGWNLSPNGDSTGFDLGTSYSTREIVAEEADKILNGGVDTEYVNLYAVYRPSTFTIVYDGNGGEGSVDSQNITYGDGTTQLNSNSFTREGYHFAGWKGTYNGMTIQFLVNGGSINNNLISEDGFVLTLQAQWALDPDYTISYDYDGGAVDEDNPTSYNVETESFTLNRPTKQGYTFDHWEGYSQDEDVTIEQGSTGDRSFKAVYTPNEDTEYRVEHYQENIGGGYSLIDTDYEEGITAGTAVYTTKDYDGFELASEPLSQTIAADGSTVVRIEYNRKSYELIIINDESTVTGNVKYGEEVILDPGVKNGYSFVRWEGIENLVEDGGTYRMPIADEGLTLTAVWQIVNSTPVAGGGGGRSISSSSSTLVEEHNSASEDKEQNKLEKRLESKELEKNDELKEDDKPLDDVVMSGDENGLDVVEENNDGIDYSQNKVFNHEESVKEKSPSPLTRGEVAVMTNILLEVYPQIIEGKQEVNEACSEYADEQDFTSQEKRAITKLCRHAIMGIHEEDDTPLDEFMVSENATEEEFARIVNRVVSNYDDSSLEVVKESLNKLSESKENVVFGTVYDVFMQIKKLFD